jgi:hypothetical protein
LVPRIAACGVDHDDLAFLLLLFFFFLLAVDATSSRKKIQYSHLLSSRSQQETLEALSPLDATTRRRRRATEAPGALP